MKDDIEVRVSAALNAANMELANLRNEVNMLRANAANIEAKARIAALEEAAGVCEDYQRDFASEQYATGQPMSSFAERFACGQCATAIRSLIGEPEWIDPPRMTLGKQGD